MSKENKLIPELRFPEFKNEKQWVQKKLGSVAEIITGSTPSTIEPKNYNGNKLFVSPADINDNRYVSQTKTRLSDIGFSKTRQIQANSVLFVCIGSTIGKVAQNKLECATNQQINSLIPYEGNSTDFLYSILDSNSKKIASIAGNHAVPIINKTSFSAIELCFPPKPEEQQKIAACLSSLDDLIAAQNDKLESLKDHKKGLMQNLFPKQGETVPKYRFPEFVNYGDWIENKLGEIAENLDSKRVPITSNQRIKGNVPYYGASGIIDYIKDYIFNEKLLCISEDGANLIDRNYPIAFSIYEKSWVNNHAHVLKFKNFNTQTLVENYVNSINIENFLTGMAQPKRLSKNG